MKYLCSRIHQKIIMKNFALVLTGNICYGYHSRLQYRRACFITQPYLLATSEATCFHHPFLRTQKFICLQTVPSSPTPSSPLLSLSLAYWVKGRTWGSSLGMHQEVRCQVCPWGKKRRRCKSLVVPVRVALKRWGKGIRNGMKVGASGWGSALA